MANGSRGSMVLGGETGDWRARGPWWMSLLGTLPSDGKFLAID